MSWKIVFAFICAAALCCGQTEAGPSSGAAPAPKDAPATAGASTPAANPQANAGPAVTPEPTPPAATEETSTPPAAGTAPKPAEEAKVPAEKAGATPASGKKPYVLGPMDVVTISVWNQPNLSRPFDIGPDGMLSIPLIGQIKADGLTQKQLEAVVAERLRQGKFVNNPEVNVQLAAVHSKRYFVYGQVNRPGEYPLAQETTIMDALSNVGGFRDFANTKKIYVLRGTTKHYFNYNDVSKGKHLETDIELENGDRLYIP